jgi:hypothetical protein
MGILTVLLMLISYAEGVSKEFAEGVGEEAVFRPYLLKLEQVNTVIAYREHDAPPVSRVAGDFMDFGERIRVPSRGRLSILLGPQTLVVIPGGGWVRIAKSVWEVRENPYTIFVEKGFAFIEPQGGNGVFVRSPHGSWIVEKGPVWVQSRLEGVDIFPDQGGVSRPFDETSLKRGNLLPLTSGLATKLVALDPPFRKFVESQRKSVHAGEHTKTLEEARRKRWIKTPLSR